MNATDGSVHSDSAAKTPFARTQWAHTSARAPRASLVMRETNAWILMNALKYLDRTESAVSLPFVRIQSAVSAVGALLEVMASRSPDV
jgi:hypothetical protein